MSKQPYRNFAGYVRGPLDMLAAIDRVLASIQTVRNCTRGDAIGHLLLMGMENALEVIENEGDREEVRRALNEAKLARVLQKARSDRREINRGIRELGTQEVIKLALESGMDLKEVEDVLAKTGTETSWTDRMATWLHMMLDDGFPHSIDSIRNAAVKEEILPTWDHEEFDSKWNSMRSLAAKSGFSKGGVRGYWQISNSKLN